MDGLVELANKSFNLVRCSPFYHFDRESHSAKTTSLAIHLASGLQLSIHGRKAKENARGELINLRFDTLSIPELQLNPIRVKITLRLANDAKDTHHLFILIPATVASTENVFTYFPLMLYRSKTIIATEVLEWFKKSYQCQFDDLLVPAPTFHSIIRTWVSTLFDLAPLEDEVVKVPMRAVQHSLELEYVTHLKELSTIRVKLKTQEVIKLCKKLKNQEDFIFALQDHIFSITKINMSALTLNELTTTNLGIRRDGKFKMFGHISRTDAVKIIEELIELASTK